MKTISETTAKRQLNQLQVAIIDGLEDIKAQNIQVFDTTELSPLFERVIIASATSSRQTKALAASVRDKIREAGFDKPRIEGEDNGEWVIVDAGAIVAHIMQPVVRDYYRLEEIWGDKPVKRLGAAAKAARAAKTAEKAAAKSATRGAADEGAAQAPAATRKTAAKKTAVKKTAASKAAATKADAGAATAGTAKALAGGKAKTAVKTAAKTPARKPAASKSAAGTAPAAKKVVVKTAAAKKPAAKKTAAKK